MRLFHRAPASAAEVLDIGQAADDKLGINRQHRKRRTWLRLAAALIALVLLAGAALCLYAAADLPAAPTADAALQSTPAVQVSTLSDGSLVFAPVSPQAGLVFYPGGKVELSAYAPLMQACAERGILCVLVKMPLNLAVLRPQAAASLPAQFPQVPAGRWYLGGHSLGGAMAAVCAKKHSETFSGLILLAAYSTVDLRQSGLSTLSIYGTQDGVLNREKYESYRTNLPTGYTEVVLDGGCHAGFGDYGAQNGDGAPTISGPEQRLQTVQTIVDFVGCPA